jgi:PAS domain S-box-containing protein
MVNARLGVAHSTNDGIFYVARGEYGTIQRSGQVYSKRSVPAPDLGDSYGSEVDSQGIGWLELGTSRVGRLDPKDGSPSLQIFGPRDGITEGWVEIYQFDGIARFHLNSHLYRFDDAQRRFVEDRELLARFPQFAAAGRPVTDRFGRMWYSDNRTAQVIDRSATGGNRPIRIPSVGFAPTHYTAEDNGVVWMFEKRRLDRIDLRLPAPPDAPLRALITSVRFPNSNRQLFAPHDVLEPLDYSDNTLVIRFAAPSNPFVLPITFEVLLEGAGTHWVSTGTVGSATFNRLKEGDYVFRVRPVAGGTAPGAEARLQFTVQPPWFRTPLAWVIYVLGTAGLFAFVMWYSSYLQRRENERLERLVAERTRELNTTNVQLGRQIQETTEKSAALVSSEERYRQLNTELEGRVQQRTAELSEASGLLDAMLENTPDLIYFKNRESRFVRFSHAFAARFKIDDHRLILGKTDFDFFSAEHAQAAFDDERHIIATGEAIIDKLEKETYADGHVTWALTTKMPWRDGSQRIVGSFGISKDVTAWKEAEAKLADTHRQLVDASRMAGMAEVATGVLHNVGNVLNSLNVSATVIATGVRQSRVESLAKVAAMLDEHAADLAGFLTMDPKGRRLPELIATLAHHFSEERTRLAAEITSLQNNIEHVKEIVARQQTYANVVAIVEPHEAVALMDEALHINAAALVRHEVRLVREFQPVPPVLVEKGKVLQILINLIRNAKYACDDAPKAEKVITVGIEAGKPGFVRFIVRDNGIGIPPENLTRIFGQGFTTRAYGHGFGLHSSIIAARDLKGTLTVHSDGPGTGATFTLELPAAVPSEPATAADPEGTLEPAHSTLSGIGP